MATDPLEQTLQARSVARILTERAKRDNDAEMIQEALPVILKALLRSLMHTVRICDACWTDHFQPKPGLPHRDCLNVRCECWCTTRRDQ